MAEGEKCHKAFIVLEKIEEIAWFRNGEKHDLRLYSFF